MGISDYLWSIMWPYEKPFSKVPCAREAAIAGLITAPCAGAAVVIFRGKPPTILKASLLSGLGVFWTGFILCRIQYSILKKASEEFSEAVASGKFD